MITGTLHNLTKGSASGRTTPVGLVHPHEIARLGLTKILEELIPGAGVICCSNPRDMTDHQDEKITLIVAELNLKQPECSLSSLETLHNAFPGVRILALSPLSERHMGLPAMKVGANVFLPMDTGLKDLRAAVEALLAVRDYMTSEMAAFMADEAQ